MRKVMRTNNFIKTLSISLILIFGLALSIIASTITNAKTSVNADGASDYGVDATTQANMETWNTSWIDHYLYTGDGKDAKVLDKNGDQVVDTNTTDGKINIGGTDYNIDELGQISFKIPTTISTVAPGYTEIEYLQSSGTQYIDTGYIHKANTSIDIDVMIPNVFSYNTFYGGATSDNSSDSFTLGVMSGGGLNCDLTAGFVPISGTSGKIMANTRYSIQLSAQQAVINGATYSTGKTTGASSTYTDAIFTRHLSSGYMSEIGQARIYSLKVYEGNELVRNYVPAQQNTNSVYGMYETVTNTFFTNDGTGDFIAGNSVYNYHTYVIRNGNIYQDNSLITTITNVNDKQTFTIDSVAYYIQNGKLYQSNDDVCLGKVTQSFYQKATISATAGLPSQYTRVEYIQASGASGQYISTGITGSAKWTYDMAWTNPTYRQLMGYNGGSGYWGINGGKYEGTNIAVVADRRDIIVWDCTGNGYPLIINGETGRKGFSTSGICRLLSLDGGYLNSAKLYSCTVEQNGAVVRNYIPCKDDNGVYGLYDTVNNTFTKAVGTAFTGGDDVDTSAIDSGDYYINNSEVYKNGSLVATINANGEFTYNTHSYIVKNNMIYYNGENGIYCGTVTSSRFFVLNDDWSTNYNNVYSISYQTDNLSDYGWIKYIKSKYYTVDTLDSNVDVYIKSELSDMNISGAGTQNSPYIIDNIEKLTYIAYMMKSNRNYSTKSGGIANIYRSKYFKVTTDLNMAGYNWESIGYYDGSDYTNCYANFDFDNHTISNIYTKVKPYQHYTGGLFDVVKYATIKNLVIDTAYIDTSKTSGEYTGILTAYNTYSTISNVTIENSTIKARCNYSGMVTASTSYSTYNDITIQNCKSAIERGDTYASNHAVGFGYVWSSSITGVDVLSCGVYVCIQDGHHRGYSVGILVGRSVNLSLYNAYMDGDTEIVSYAYNMGGMVGEASGSLIMNGCVSRASVTATADCKNGGLLGIITDCTRIEITNCANYGTVNGYSSLGGIVGYAEVTTKTVYAGIQNCYNFGTINGSSCLGGIIGNIRNANPNLTFNITNCTNYGAINGNGDKLGGIVGYVSAYTTQTVIGQGYFNNIKYMACPVYITKSINAGNITTTSTYAGGIVGYVYSLSTRVEECINKGTVKCSNYGGGITGIWFIDTNFFISDSTTNDNYITNCYNTGKVQQQNTSNTYFAGIISYISVNGLNSYDTTTALTIQNCYSSGTIPTNGYNLFYAYYNSSKADKHKIVVNNVYVTARADKDYVFYNNEKGVSLDQNAQAVTAVNFNANNKFASMNDFKNISNFVGFDFANVWNINASSNSGTPYLRSIETVQVIIHASDETMIYYGYRQESYDSNTQTLRASSSNIVNLGDVDIMAPLCYELVGYSLTSGGSVDYQLTDNVRMANTSYTYLTPISEIFNRFIHLYPVYAESDIKIYQISLASIDESISGAALTDNIIYYDSVNKHLYANSIGTQTIDELSITTTLGDNNNFKNWQVYRAKVKMYEILDDTFGSTFNVLSLINKLYENGITNYLSESPDGNTLGIISLRSNPENSTLKIVSTYNSNNGTVIMNGEAVTSDGVSAALGRTYTITATSETYRYIQSISIHEVNEDQTLIDTVWVNSVQVATTYNIVDNKIKLNNIDVATISGNTFTLGTSDYVIDQDKIIFGNYIVATIVNNSFTINPTIYSFDWKFDKNIELIISFDTVKYSVNFVATDSTRNTSSALVSSQIFDINNMTIGTGSNFDEVTVNVPSKWQFKHWYIKNNNTDMFDILNNNIAGLTSVYVEDNFLDKYLNNGVITIYASFSKLYDINVQVDGGHGSFIICKDKITNDVTQSYLNNGGQFSATFIEGSIVYLTVVPDADYILKEITGLGDITLNGSYASFALNEDKDITIVYREFAYEIVVKSYNTSGSIERNYLTDTKTYVADEENNYVAKGQSLTKITTDLTNATNKHRFDKYQIWSNTENAFVPFNIGLISTSGNMVSSTGESVLVNDAFIQEHAKNNQILIRTVYCLQYLIDISIQGSGATMGTFNVEIYNGDTKTYTKQGLTSYSEYLDKGLKVKIIAEAKKGFVFNKFFPSNSTFDSEAQSIMFNVSQARTVALEFANETFTLNMANLTYSGGEIEITANNMPIDDTKLFKGIEVGDQIVVSFKPQMGYEVNTFTINGKNISELPSAVLESNTLTLTVTSELLDMLNSTNDIDVNVSASLATLYLAILVGAPTLFLLILVIIIVNIIGNNRLRAQVKARLNAEFTQSMKFDSAGMIKGLKQGKAVGQVTDEDIKREMKNEKKKK